jgi:hypothetical protein
MIVSSRTLVELVLLGPSNDRRQLQDSPILGDVWIAYAMKPADAIDLLITPHKEHGAGPVAMQILKRLGKVRVRTEGTRSSEVAYLHDDFTIHLTYPIDEIDAGRKADWTKEQNKEKARKKKIPTVKVRANWSAKKNSLKSFFGAHKKFAEKVLIVPDDKPHVINLLDEV